MKKIYWIIAGGVVLIASLVAYKALSGTTATKVYTNKASGRNIIEVVSATGKIQPETELKISSDVSGEITEMMVKEGQEVKKGDLLCRIRPDLYVSALERVNASVNTTRANVKTAEAQLQQARATLANAESVFNRNKKLFDQKAISLQEFEAAKTQFESAAANVSALEAGVKAGEYTIESSEASLKEANTNLEKTYIYSPVDATVSKLSVEKGERVVGVSGMSGTEIMRLANLNEMEASVEVNENDIIKVHLGDTALIEVDAYMDRVFKGIVTEIANSSNSTGFSAEQVTNFIVKIRLLRESYSSLINPSNPIPFRPGMSASVDIQTRRVKNAIAIPIQAVTTRHKDSLKTKINKEEEENNVKVVNQEEEKENKTSEEKTKEYVFVMKKGVCTQVEVKTGIQDNDYIEVKSGVNTGDEIICGPYTAVKTLKNKQNVKIVKKEDLYKNEAD